jgi:magnesium transporter
MLNFYSAVSNQRRAMDPSGSTSPLWIDVTNPSADEVAQIEKLTGAKLPSMGALSEVQASRRLRNENGVLYMSTPSAAMHPEQSRVTPPLGSVLSRDQLITVRFMALATFDAVADKFTSERETPKSSLDVFVFLCEEIVDRVADILENVAGELNVLAVDTFHTDDTRGRHSAHSNRLLRVQLRQVGRLGDRLSEVRDGIQGLARVVAYTEQNCEGWFTEAPKSAVATLHQDLHSLIEYEEQLANKVQFVLDALVGLIGIVQNDVIKILTIVSIAGIPPTLVAGIYGMNFKSMPEYGWSWGYPYAWGAIILSTILPLIWFKRKGWF